MVEVQHFRNIYSLIPFLFCNDEHVEHHQVGDGWKLVLIRIYSSIIPFRRLKRKQNTPIYIKFQALLLCYTSKHQPQ